MLQWTSFKVEESVNYNLKASTLPKASEKEGVLALPAAARSTISLAQYYHNKGKVSAKTIDLYSNVIEVVKFLQHSKQVRFRMNMLKGKKLYFENWHNPGYGILTIFDHIHGHYGLKTITYHLKINSHHLIFNSSTGFIRDFTQISQMWKTLFTKIMPYFHRLVIMSIFKVQQFCFRMLIFGQKSC